MAAQQQHPGDSGNAKASPAQIAKALKGIDYPKQKDAIVDYARQQQPGDRNVIAVLEKLPDREYHNMADLEKAVGQVE
ncbi:MAG TPA: DUF2795 domain-containing protein [Tepidisphaeraceae bacterium]|nr:DUF2795 domain-containing protein [Tepidisphaeraceae bacterium]